MLILRQLKATPISTLPSHLGTNPYYSKAYTNFLGDKLKKKLPQSLPQPVYYCFLI